jgi:DNA-binding Lrp family transcriptional regulator
MEKTLLLDEIDRRILDILQQRSNIPNNALADEVGLTPGPCLRRVQRLKSAGVIRRFTVELDESLLGMEISAFVEITLSQHTKEVAHLFMKAVQGKPQVLSCHMVAGDCDFILQVVTRNLKEYRRLIWEDLHRIKGVEKIHSIMVLDTLKGRSSLSIG